MGRLRSAGLFAAGIALAMVAVAILLAGAVLAVWVLVDDPEPSEPSFYEGTRVEQCLPAADVAVGRIWICGFFRISPGLRQQLRAAEPTSGADRLRIACFLGPPLGSASDGPEPLGFAAPDRLTSPQRCREEIDLMRLRRPVDVDDIEGQSD